MMHMSFRWYGPNQDSITFNQIRQIPGMEGVITALHEIPAGEPWPYEKVMERKAIVEKAGLKILGVESINVHEDIKYGAKDRDRLIENYIKSIEAVGRAGIHLVCYNFMPVFDWTRTDLAMPLPDGSRAMAYDGRICEGLTATQMFDYISKNSNGFEMPGWELNRKGEITAEIEKFSELTPDDLRANFKYFLDAIMPTCEKFNVKMGVHPDDPSYDLFGLPRICKCEDDLVKIARMNSSPCNGFTLCTGSLGSNPQNDIPRIIRNKEIAPRIHFAHVRNVKHTGDHQFHESAHISRCGSLDLYEIMKALVETGFNGVVRPDHGREIWDEKARPGYGLYDRALGAAYLQGLEEAIRKDKGMVYPDTINSTLQGL
ncbi:MAG: mannonate dehydratase [Aeromonadales bacterium]|nr:mannonate dehydratase [Aeromonadales bacterium]MDY2890058.1 mannonate dehydratase [Succinivibrio sp.]